jgi:putative flavoprotein involved in K+ transport
VRFSDGLGERLAAVDAGLDKEFRPMFDAYIAAAGIDAPPDDRPSRDDFMPATSTKLDLDAAGVRGQRLSRLRTSLSTSSELAQ